MKTRINKLLEKMITETAKFKQVGQWSHYYDGSSEFYAKMPLSQLKRFVASDEYNSDEPYPFETAIPEGDKDVMFYDADSEQPRETINIDDYNVENDTDYEDVDSFMADDQS